jgi:IS5 family transposase
MRKHIADLFKTKDSSYSIIDSMPMKACHFARAHFAKVFKGDASFGFCAAKNERYYGFKLHARVSAEGFIQEYSVTAANYHDTTATMEICEHCNTPIVLWDKGYIGKELADSLKKEKGISLITPTRNNSKNPMSKSLASLLGKQRKRVEITFSQLVEQFKFGVIKSKTTKGLACRVIAKVLGHNVLYLINQFRGAKNVSNIKSLVYI